MQKTAIGSGYSHGGKRCATKTLLVMKLTFFLMTVACLNVTAKGLSQTIRMAVRDVPIEKVFAEVEKQTGYFFMYFDAKLSKIKPVSIKAEDMPLERFLEQLLENRPLDFSIKGKNVFIFARQLLAGSLADAATAAIPPISITGRVLNEKGEPVVATINIKGNNKSASTNAQGYFELREVDDNAVLIISGVSIERTEVKLNGRKELTIQVKTRVEQQQEVMVTAYGVEKSAKEIGYSVAKVSGEELTRANTGNVLTGLTGRVSGLNISTQSPDMTPQMQVLLRGVRSFASGSNNQPLFILNGTPLSFGSDQSSAALMLDFINNINPNDVDNVTVLKGANATALYGPQGVNGVIIITTKKGQKGKPAINARSSASFQRTDYRYQKFLQRSYGSGTGLTDANGNGIYDPRSNNGWGPAYDGSLVQIGRPDENGQLQKVTYSDKKDDRRFFNVASTIQNNISISQGDANSDFYLGIGFQHQKGILPGDSRKALNAMLSGSRKLGRFNAQYNVNFSRSTADLGPENFGPSGPTFIPYTSYKDYKNDKWSDQNHYWSDEAVVSPYQKVASDRKRNTENALVVSIPVTFRALPWLTIKDDPGIVFRNSYFKRTIEPVVFSDWAKVNGGPTRRLDQYASLSDENTTVTTLNNNFLITAVNKAGAFSFRNIIGNQVSENYLKTVSGSTVQLSIPVYNLAFSRDVAPGVEYYLLSRSYSWFGTSSINFKERVFMELMIRNDWDSKRAQNARGKDLYAGANTSVILNELLPGLKKLSWLSNLQLRAAINTTANMNIEPFQSQRTLEINSSVGFPFGDALGYAFKPGVPNPFLKPEKVLSQEYGFIASLWKDKVNLNVAWYNQRNDGVIMRVYQPWLSGAPTLDNFGVLKNYGLEADLKFNSIIKTPGGFTLNGGLLFSYNANKVKSISAVYNGIFTLVQLGEKGNYSVVAREGSHAFEYLVYDFARDDQGRVIVNKTTGLPSVDMRKPLYTGSTLPKFSGGINVNLNWKNFTFTALGEFNFGAMHYFQNAEASTRGGFHEFTTYNNRKPFVIPNSSYDDGSGKYVDNTTVKTMDANRNFYFTYSRASVNYLTKADFFRIRELSLNYEKNFKSGVLRRVNLGVFGRNVFNFYSKDNIYGDPQLVKGPGRVTGGVTGIGGAAISGPNANGSGSGSNSYTQPGLVEYGVILSVGL